MNDEMVKVAMQIILHAGNARTLISDAMKHAVNDCNKATDLLQEAHEELLIAHKTQTNMIQKEAEGEKFENSLLFNHAQDTLMVTGSEYNTAKNIIVIVNQLCEMKGEKE